MRDFSGGQAAVASRWHDGYETLKNSACQHCASQHFATALLVAIQG